MTLLPTVGPGKVGPMQVINTPFSAGVAVALSIDGKEVALIFTSVAVKTLPGPQVEVAVELL